MLCQSARTLGVSNLKRFRLRHASPTLPSASTAAEPPAPAVEQRAQSASLLTAAIETTRALAFYLLTFAAAVPLFACMLFALVPVLLLDGTLRAFMHSINHVWASFSRMPFFRVDVHGADKLPSDGERVVYVANHSSYLDIFSLLALRRPFRFISKRSVFLFPVVGWAMFLTGHISLARDDRRSQMRVLEACRAAVREGLFVLRRGALVLRL
jgi:1-acyl-sn-glycerol-3-phosphate acyltransferase